VAGEHRSAYLAGAEPAAAYCPMRACRAQVIEWASGRMRGQRWSVSPCPRLRGLRRFCRVRGDVRPLQLLDDVSSPGAVDVRVSPAQGCQVARRAVVIEESPWGDWSKGLPWCGLLRGDATLVWCGSPS